MTKYEVVYVEWVDSESDDSWQAISDMKNEICTCKSVGFLLRETPKCITIARDLAFEHDRDCSGVMKIPLVCVIRMIKTGIYNYPDCKTCCRYGVHHFCDTCDGKDNYQPA